MPSAGYSRRTAVQQREIFMGEQKGDPGKPVQEGEGDEGLGSKTEGIGGPDDPSRQEGGLGGEDEGGPVKGAGGSDGGGDKTGPQPGGVPKEGRVDDDADTVTDGATDSQ